MPEEEQPFLEESNCCEGLEKDSSEEEEEEYDKDDDGIMRNPAVKCLIGLILFFPVVQYTFAAADSGDSDLSKYMYLKEDPKDVYPIVEYKARSSLVQVHNVSKDRPDFLYDPDYPHHRIVEFYAHW